MTSIIPNLIFPALLLIALPHRTSCMTSGTTVFFRGPENYPLAFIYAECGSSKTVGAGNLIHPKFLLTSAFTLPDSGRAFARFGSVRAYEGGILRELDWFNKFPRDIYDQQPTLAFGLARLTVPIYFEPELHITYALLIVHYFRPYHYACILPQDDESIIPLDRTSGWHDLGVSGRKRNNLKHQLKFQTIRHQPYYLDTNTIAVHKANLKCGFQYGFDKNNKPFDKFMKNVFLPTSECYDWSAYSSYGWLADDGAGVYLNGTTIMRGVLQTGLPRDLPGKHRYSPLSLSDLAYPTVMELIDQNDYDDLEEYPEWDGDHVFY